MQFDVYLFLNISKHVEHHAEGVEHVPSVQHVDVAVDQNVNVHDVAFSSNKNACYVVLVLNYRLVTIKNIKRVCQFNPFTCPCNRAPFTTVASCSSKEEEPL